MGNKLQKSFFTRDVLEVAPDLLGKAIVRVFPDQSVNEFLITEVEAYRGEEDLACHASKGRTNRTEIMYHDGGFIYIYLIYGMHYMLNFVTSVQDNPQAVLIRGVDQTFGPGRVAKLLQINKTLNTQSVLSSPEIWIEDKGWKADYSTDVRVGIDYAGNYWKNKPWRYISSIDDLSK